MANAIPSPHDSGWREHVQSGLKLSKGVGLACVVAMAATFVSDHYGGPQLLYALLMGLALHHVTESPDIKLGIDFSARSLLRVGVALLGARITVDQVTGLGISAGVLVACGMVLTIFLGLGLARLLSRPLTEGVLSGSSVAICGASAALAVSAVLPQNKENARFTLLVVVGVTVLSTMAMIIYPYVLNTLHLSAQQDGIFLGGTIHDVAQVVAAGMLVGPEAADVATVVKLFRVLLLLPIVMVISVAVHRHQREQAEVEHVGKRPPLMPLFLLAFLVMVALSSFGVFSAHHIALASETSRWLLVIAIAAAGMKTNFKDLAMLGWQPLAMLVGETVFLAVFVLGFLALAHIGLS